MDNEQLLREIHEELVTIRCFLASLAVRQESDWPNAGKRAKEQLEEGVQRVLGER
jgi:hypothetical protein